MDKFNRTYAQQKLENYMLQQQRSTAAMQNNPIHQTTADAGPGRDLTTEEGSIHYGNTYSNGSTTGAGAVGSIQYGNTTTPWSQNQAKAASSLTGLTEKQIDREMRQLKRMKDKAKRRIAKEDKIKTLDDAFAAEYTSLPIPKSFKKEVINIVQRMKVDYAKTNPTTRDVIRNQTLDEVISILSK